jgi:C4-dicarboxylate-specific signal transduction histidine kinase
MGAAVGDNLIYACRRATEAGHHLAREIADGLASVLERAPRSFRTRIDDRLRYGGNWWSLGGVPLNRPEGGAVVICADITELRRAEMDAQRSRQELAHVGRVSTVGEMTASLAHQLNQPLAAIMTNAQAAGRMLSTTQPDIDEIRAILRTSSATIDGERSDSAAPATAAKRRTRDRVDRSHVGDSRSGRTRQYRSRAS